MYQVVVVLEVGLLLLHGGEDGLEGGDQVVEDNGPPLLAFGLVKAAGVDDAHLLQHGGLAALSGTCGMFSTLSLGAWAASMRTEQQQLDLALLALLVIPDDLVNLLIATTLRVDWFLAEAHYTRGHSLARGAAGCRCSGRAGAAWDLQACSRHATARRSGLFSG